ncbi:MAG TPA: hypothetical protein VHZ98_14425 [Galbitalea sp.]|jgi:hypothetical protein|nr:hypothetical protein [Galbitalea sp.]
MSNLEEEYRRLLRWYPRAWRDQNEEVVLGTLLDSALARGLTALTVEDSRTIRLAGLRQRAIGSGQRSLVGTLALATGVAFTVFYCAFVSWDPSHTFNGYVGPFTNPSFTIGLLLAISLVLTIRRLTFAAHLVAMLAIAVSVLFGILAWSMGWLGPSLPAVVLFSGFGVCGLSRSNRISRGLLLVSASVCAEFAAVSIDTMRVQSEYVLSPFWQEETTIAVVAVIAAILLAWPWHYRRARDIRSSEHG